MTNFRSTLREVLADVARLRMPVTAAALTTTAVGLANSLGVQPFGVDLSQQTTHITAALTLVGIIAGLISKWTSPPA